MLAVLAVSIVVGGSLSHRFEYYSAASTIQYCDLGRVAPPAI